MLEVEGLAICGLEEEYDGFLPVIRFGPTNGEIFGIGWHPSTQEALGRLKKEIRPNCSVLDFGTGTGILALAAKIWGADRVVAVENEEKAFNYAAEHIALNNTEIELTKEIPNEQFDIVIANVGDDVVKEFLEQLQEKLNVGGVGIWEFNNA